jgi:hypothetical protein
MFLFREYVVCLLVPLVLAGFVVAVCGIGYLLKITGILCLQSFQAYNSRKVICSGTPGAMSDRRS